MFVLDASVTAGWIFPDEVTSYTEAVLVRVQREGGLVPVVWPLEVANMLLVGERRQRTTQSQTAQLTQYVFDLPISVAGPNVPDSAAPLVALARQERLSAYDASYLQLAMEERLPLATLDNRLREAALRVGVSLVAEE